VTRIQVGSWHGGTIRTERAASPRKGKTSAICSSKSPTRLPFTLTKAPVHGESAFTSSAILSWFRRESSGVKLPRDVSGAEALKALERLGFTTIRQTGSHVRMAQGNRRVTVPMHRKLVVGTLQSILRQAGVSVEDFVNAL
jgi:predicted RNA binding protein YcfA (HicA-like mRNA interferase family)